LLSAASARRHAVHVTGISASVTNASVPVTLGNPPLTLSTGLTRINLTRAQSRKRVTVRVGASLTVLTVKIKFRNKIHVSGQLTSWFPNFLVVSKGHVIHPDQEVTPQQILPEVTQSED
jgi:hypothetical protein